ncbi:hypothetical protein DL764_001152 [Monosporascus ibericus]|uniref:O-methyltransferase C-terminal domain-containing protein n=1 Tax=Monosporascus ibericus TaxID=155417 RepID=A0A4Q4TVE2_9PEZI|nr:hypothetical protein DL764_001152 [Monosporascus ibericus]
MASQYETLAAQIESLLQNPGASAGQDEQVLRRLAEGGRKLSIAFEDRGASLRRIGYTHFQSPLACVGVEAGVFAALAADPSKTFTNAELAEKTGVDPKLLKRLLRYYQSQDMVSQTSHDGYKANNVTLSLGNSDYGASLRFFTKVIAPAAVAMPEFLEKQSYRNPEGVTPGAFHMGHHTDLHPFMWSHSRPEILGLFLPWMNIQREGRPTFFDVLDVERELVQPQGSTSSTPLFVDIGGAMGAQCIAFRKRYPGLVGRVILQDLPQVVDQVKASPLPGFEKIEAEAYDFFTPETVKGAYAYYLRNVLHDWPDAKVVEILTSIKAGMTKDSVVLIDETVLSECCAPWRAVQQDVEMLAVFSASERTEAEWRKLIDEAGLATRDVRRYTEEYEDTVIVAALK